MPNQRFTHLDAQGNAIMVDVSAKPSTARAATASGRITMSAECYDALKSGGIPKGDAIATARIAGIMAAKKTSELIPLCHPLFLTKASVDFSFHDADHSVGASCTCAVNGQTGVEMEALTGASVALLTLYDMCKALDKSMTIEGVRLIEKRGGKSGDYHA